MSFELAHLERLPLRGGQCIKRLVACCVDSCFVRHHVLIADAAVYADLVERNLSMFQQLNEERARNVEDVRCVLSGQFGVNRGDVDRVACANLSQNIHK